MTDLRTPTDITSHLVAELANGSRPPAGAIVTLAVKAGTLPRLLAGTLEVKRSRPEVRPTLHYPTITLFEQWITSAEVEDWISRLFAGTMDFDGTRVPCSQGGGRSEKRGAPQHVLSGWAEEVVYVTVDTNTLSQGYDAVVREGQPPYKNMREAARAWVYGHRMDGMEDTIPNEGQLLIIIPDERGRVRSALWDGPTVEVELEGTATPGELELQAVFEGSALRSHELVRVDEMDLSIEVPIDARQVRLFLVAGDASLSSVLLTRARPGLGVLGEVVPSENQAADDLRRGENEHVEYKPFVGQRAEKATEIVEAVIAFANSGGGTVYVGVDRYGRPQGARALHKAFRRTDDPLTAQREFLTLLISDAVKPGPPCEFADCVVRGDSVVTVTVLKGTKRPYSTINNLVFLRKGGSCHIADPHTELPEMYRRLL